MRPRRLTGLSALLTVSLTLSGCQLFFPAAYFPPDYPDPPMPSFDIPPPQQEFSYTSGSATIEISDGQSIVLDRVVEGSGAMYGSTKVTWRNDEGWALSLISFAMPSEPVSPFDTPIVIKRVVDKSLWVTNPLSDPTNCRVRLDHANANGLSGDAECTHLRWQDGLTGELSYPVTPSYIDGQDPFDATVTFEATGAK